MNTKLNENAIREAAYYIWQNAGCPNGQEAQHWALAVEQLSSCTCKKTSSSSKKSSSSCASKSTSSTKKSSKK
ncbi:MAG: DUF2934 domain-containing protein [Alphaproteobacteria bacterium]|nr:DUF2934 domain-containing protein [Alphaproteobacteria bacterium]